MSYNNSLEYSNDVIVIMAGGEGKRMNSNLPKVLHLLSNKPMIVHVLEKALNINPMKIYIIVGKHKDIIETTIYKYIDSELIKNKLEFVFQNKPLGTGHAIKIFCDHINNSISTNLNLSKVLILSGDVPLITIDTIKIMLNTNYAANILVSHTDNNYGYGRIIQEYDIKNNYYYLKKIVEEKDCTESEKYIKIINSGIYSINYKILNKYIYYIENKNSQSEYYLTDIFEIINKVDGNHINIVELEKKNIHEIMGVNTKEQLEYLQELNELKIMFKK